MVVDTSAIVALARREPEAPALSRMLEQTPGKLMAAPTYLECLGCGARRPRIESALSHLETGECPRCGYLGWASPTDLTEYTRRALRERPVERRRLRAAT